MNKSLAVRIVAGAPDLATTEELLRQLQAAGVAAVQLVLPFSDPMAAGPLVQQAGAEALAGGTNIHRVFQLLDKLGQELTLQLTLVTYMNPLLTYGYAAFFQRCSQAGVHSLLVVDLPYEEREELLALSQQSGVLLLTTLAVSQPRRMEEMLQQAQGLIYLTGGDRLPEVNRRRVEQLVAKARSLTQLPLLLGYSGEQLEEALDYGALGEAVLLENLVLERLAEQGRSCLPALVQELGGLVRKLAHPQSGN